MKITVDDRKWEVPKAAIPGILWDAEHRIGWQWLIGCERCGTICLSFHSCKCCSLPKSQRPYDLDGGHSQVLPVATFVERVKPKEQAA